VLTGDKLFLALFTSHNEMRILNNGKGKVYVIHVYNINAYAGEYRCSSTHS